MIPYIEALNLLEECARGAPPVIEEIALEDACGRVLAADVVASEHVPPFDNSAMDGFAVYSADLLAATQDRPVELVVVGVHSAGGKKAGSRTRPARGECVSIMTGAPLPDGCDAVIRVEDVETRRETGDGVFRIRVRRPVAAGQDIRLRGTDFKPGVRVAAAGDLVDPHRVLAMAAVGIRRVTVFRRPRVLIISTGDELAPSDELELGEGHIRNSTGPMLRAALALMGLEVVGARVAWDNSCLYQSELREIMANEEVDLVVSTGAVSVGDFDFVRPALLAEGAKIHFHKAAIRPGKPILFAELPRSSDRPLWYFGLPGNPVSTVVGLRFFLNPFLRALLGRTPEAPQRLRLSETVRKAEGLRSFLKAVVVEVSEESRTKCLEGQASYLIHPLLDSQVWAVLPEADTVAPEGMTVDVFRLFDDWKGGSR